MYLAKKKHMNNSIRLSAMACLLFLAVTSFAQDKVLFTPKTDSTHRISSIGFSIAPVMQFGQLGPQRGLSMAIHLNNRFEIGGAFLSSMRDRDEVTLGQRFYGITMNYTPHTSKLIHLSFPLMIGRISQKNDALMYQTASSSGRFGLPYPGDGPFYPRQHAIGVQPGVNLEMNVLKHVKIFTGANYRFAFGEESTSEMRGFSGQIGIKMGVFNHAIKRKKK